MGEKQKWRARKLYLEEKLIIELNNESADKPQKGSGSNSNSGTTNADGSSNSENQYNIWLDAMKVAFRGLIEKVKPFLKPYPLDSLLVDIVLPITTVASIGGISAAGTSTGVQAKPSLEIQS